MEVGNISRTLSCSVSMIVMAACAFPCFAQSAAADRAAPPLSTTPASDARSSGSSAGLDDIVVTANKRVQNINDVGLSITAVSGDALISRGISSPTDLARIVPGLTVQPSPFNTPVYTLRGVGFYETTLSAAPTVAIYTDEVLLPFSATSRGAAIDIERVEVLKGPQGTLFGANTTGGAINYIAAKPTSEFAAGLDASVGRFSTFDVQGFVSGPVSDTMKMRLALRTVQAGPWQKSFMREDELGKKDQFQGRFITDWDASDRLKLQFIVSGWTDNGDTQAAQVLVDSCGTSTAGNCGNPEAAAFHNYPKSPRNARAADWGDQNSGLLGDDATHRNARDDYFWQASLRADYNINEDVTLTAITAYSKYKTSAYQDYDGTTLSGADIHSKGHLTDISQELRANGKFDKLNITVGGNFNRSKVFDYLFYNFSEATSSNPFYAVLGAPKGITSFDYSRQRIKNYAVFANAEFELTPNLTIIGGARYTETRRKFEGCTNDGGDGTLNTFWRFAFGVAPDSPGGCVTFTPTFPVLYDPALFDQLNEHNLSWNAGVNYKTDGDMLLYTRVSKGYKSGSFPTISTSGFAGYVPVKQESVLAYEAGVKVPLLDRRLLVTAAAFYYDYKDKQLRGRVPDAVFTSLDALVQIPKSYVQGIEAQITARPIEGLTLDVGGTLIKTRIKDYTGFDQAGLLQNYDGQAFPYAPKLTLTADAEYSFDVGGGNKAFLGASLTHNSKTSATLSNRDTATVTADDRLSIRAYSLVDIRAGIDLVDRKIRISAFGRNITNKYYWTNAQDSQNTVVRFTGMPVTYGLQLNWRY